MVVSKFDLASEIQIRKKFIPIPKYVKHDILDLPVDGEPIMSDAEAGREFILSHFNVTSIPPVSFFCNTMGAWAKQKITIKSLQATAHLLVRWGVAPARPALQVAS